MLYVVGTIIFSSKSNSYVDLTYLLYLRDIELVNMYAWGPITLSFLYKELSNATVPKCKYLACYTTLLQPFNLYSGWIICGPIKVWYLPERVMRQFGYVQTIPRHPHHSAPVNISPQQIDFQFARFMDRVLTPQMLGTHALY
ncbi:putative IMP dehydrogenase/GMP reductase [Trifolium medium]|uniref:Putative IMP dehydrogenase/GMP reductase n=1 Tax=Trifolium medium TaxID=97028 RepID=A0A392NNU0_9FABA|nr:putative IMP dehydrogenase/GMP reductase [Trifolium medium]